MVEESVSGSTGHKRVIADILVIDDDPRISRVLAHYLGQEGYEVRTALDGEEMRRRIAEGPPDLVILDLMLPDEDGLTLARELRAHSDVPIIILTGKTETTEEVAALEVGADDYITKPFDKRNLLAHVHSALRRRPKRGEVSQGREGEPKESQGREEEQSRDAHVVDWYVAPSRWKSS